MSGRLLATCLMSAAVFCAPAQAQQAPSLFHSIVFPKPQMQASSHAGEPVAADAMDPAVAQAIGCVIAGAAGTGVAMAAGTENVVNIVAGGLVTPVSSVALYTAVAGVIFGTFCAVGQAITPLYMHLTRPQPSAARGEADVCTHHSAQHVGREEDFSAFSASLALRPDSL